MGRHTIFGEKGNLIKAFFKAAIFANLEAVRLEELYESLQCLFTGHSRVPSKKGFGMWPIVPISFLQRPSNTIVIARFWAGDFQWELLGFWQSGKCEGTF